MRATVERSSASRQASCAGQSQRTLATTKLVENLNGAIRRVTHRRNGPSQTIVRWAALGIAEGSRRFRRVKGHKHLPLLVDALRAIDQIRESA